MSSSPPDTASQACLVQAYDTRGSASPRSRHRLRQQLIDRLHQRLLTSDPDGNWWSDDATLFARKYSRALEAVGILSILIREALANGTVRQTKAAPFARRRPDISVPTTESISFFNLMDMPLPFAADGAAKLPYCHLATMTSKAFLEEQEWAGFCAFSPRPHELLVEWPMHGMRFVVSDHPDGLSLQTKGDDGRGGFLLYGRMTPDTGEMTLVRAYLDIEFRWNWTCMMTPFGMVGSWGTCNYGGWLWLWKVQ